MKQGKAYIGTSGWNYAHWKGTFYPSELKNTEHFDYYKKKFQTVELNNSFYHLPAEKTFSNWKSSAPVRFIFAVKANRFITHMKKLNLDSQGLRLFFSRIDHLGNKLGPILFQLPPKWKLNEDRLEKFLSALPKGYRYTFEFRDSSWYVGKVYEMLEKHNCAFCIYELAKHLSPMAITADFVYVRLHGPGNNKYEGSYSSTQLKQWAAQCNKWRKEGRDVYIYFDNDQLGYAAFNALSLKKLVA
jgi:uncharacterized protein YecE (DUF72 family)